MAEGGAPVARVVATGVVDGGGSGGGASSVGFAWTNQAESTTAANRFSHPWIIDPFTAQQRDASKIGNRPGNRVCRPISQAGLPDKSTSKPVPSAGENEWDQPDKLG